MPETWEIGSVSVIHQKGRKDECKSYFGLTVMNTISRIYGKITKYYLEEKETEISNVIKKIKLRSRQISGL